MRRHTAVKFQSPFLVLDTLFSMIQDSTHRTAARNFLKGRDPLPSLRKACASLFVAMSTAESGFIRQLPFKCKFGIRRFIDGGGPEQIPFLA